ncbi:CGNR zinc finger domain-containing protein [Streptomyces sp. NPDC059452]|uniref:CGNR zinc finger domain-containing protein n=1 Tax=Streptomyces sp. NPDC059452 TaxID=3346835 RepID=UPI0036CA24C2
MAAGRGAYVWRFDSGRICLDLVATGSGGRGRGGREQLDGPGRLADWLTAARLVPPGTGLGALDATWLTRFRELRADVERLMAAQLAAGSGRDGAAVPQLGCQGEVQALERVNSLAAEAPPGPRAVRGEGGALVRTLSAEPDCAGLLAVVARDAVDLLTDPVARGALRRCAGGACDRLYLDTSRGGRRRWCSGEVCGNRERVARHRRRTAGGSPAESDRRIPGGKEPESFPGGKEPESFPGGKQPPDPRPK